MNEEKYKQGSHPLLSWVLYLKNIMPCMAIARQVTHHTIAPLKLEKITPHLNWLKIKQSITPRQNPPLISLTFLP